MALETVLVDVDDHIFVAGGECVVSETRIKHERWTYKEMRPPFPSSRISTERFPSP